MRAGIVSSANKNVMMRPDIKRELEKESVSVFHQGLLEKCLELIKSSRSRMAEKYEAWDRQQELYNSRRPMDNQDQKLREQGVPAKFVVPLTFAQVQTWVSFCMLLFSQNKRFFELSPTGEEDFQLQETIELLIESDLRANNWPLLLYQFLIDVAKFGVGAVKTSWVKEVVEVPEMVASEASGVPVKQEQMVEATQFEGTRIYSVSPYNFFPDHRLPIRDFQRGEYCSSIQEYTAIELDDLKNQGVIADYSKSDKLDLTNAEFGMNKLKLTMFDSRKDTDGQFLITELQIKIIPDKFEVENAEKKIKLGPSKRPEIWIVWIVNDSRVVRFEKLGAYHGQFTFIAHEFLPDIHEKLNLGLAEIIDVLQEVAGWFINTRVQAVTQTIDNWLVIDPSGIEVSSVTSRQRVILMKKQAARMGVEKFLKQLDVQDTTTGHLKDAEMVMQLLQTITGVNENAMGQYNSGRRSATEARAVISGASARMRMLANLVWESLSSLGLQVMKNGRQALSPECYAYKAGPARVPLYPLYHQTAKAVVESQDYFIFDGTLPSEKSFLAQTMQELLGIVLQNPQAAQMFNLDPNKLMQEIYELRGVSGLGRFGLDPEAQARVAGGLQAAAGGVPGEPPAQEVPAGAAGAA